MKRYLPVSEGKRLNICVFACISTQKTVSLHDVNNKLKHPPKPGAAGGSRSYRLGVLDTLAHTVAGGAD